MAVQVMLEVKSLIKQDGQQNIYHYQTRGYLYQKDSVTYLQYREGTEGLVGVLTTLKLEKDRVTLIRHGSVSMRQIFQTGVKDEGVYETPYGNIDMAVETSLLELAVGLNEGYLRIYYSLFLSQELSSENTLEVTYQSSQQEK